MKTNKTKLGLNYENDNDYEKEPLKTNLTNIKESEDLAKCMGGTWKLNTEGR